MPEPKQRFLARAGIAASRMRATLSAIREARKAFDRGDYTAALDMWRPLAERGFRQEQYSLGWMYLHGYGVPQDDALAAEWFRKAADRNHAQAQADLGWSCQNGRGLPQDDLAAVEWYRKAANQRHSGARYGLGWMYFEGRGVPQNYTEAARWWRKSAHQGDAAAQYGLALMYRDGSGLPQDIGRAAKWMRKAADKGDCHAQNDLGCMYSSGQGVTRDSAQARVWFDLAATNADDEARELAARNRDAMEITMASPQVADPPFVLSLDRESRLGPRGGRFPRLKDFRPVAIYLLASLLAGAICGALLLPFWGAVALVFVFDACQIWTWRSRITSDRQFGRAALTFSLLAFLGADLALMTYFAAWMIRT